MKKIAMLALISMFVSASFAASVPAPDDFGSLHAISAERLADVRVPAVPAPTKLEAAAPLQYALLAKMTARSIKIMGLTLRGLRSGDMNDENKPPSKYTVRVNFFADELMRDTNLIEANVKFKNNKRLFINQASVKWEAAVLKRNLELIKGSENYSYWFGPDIEEAADTLVNLMDGLKESVPDFYSFVKPELKNQNLKKEWEEFVAERIESLERWENLYLGNKLNYGEFLNLIDAAADLKRMWELYQESTLKGKARDKFLKICFIREIKDNNCVYKCSGGTEYSRPIERPAPGFEEPLPSVVCPQVLFPF